MTIMFGETAATSAGRAAVLACQYAGDPDWQAHNLFLNASLGLACLGKRQAAESADRVLRKDETLADP
jgi:hypothetical protein